MAAAKRYKDSIKVKERADQMEQDELQKNYERYLTKVQAQRAELIKKQDKKMSVLKQAWQKNLADIKRVSSTEIGHAEKCAEQLERKLENAEELNSKLRSRSPRSARLKSRATTAKTSASNRTATTAATARTTQTTKTHQTHQTHQSNQANNKPPSEQSYYTYSYSEEENDNEAVMANNEGENNEEFKTSGYIGKPPPKNTKNLRARLSQRDKEILQYRQKALINRLTYSKVNARVIKPKVNKKRKPSSPS